MTPETAAGEMQAYPCWWENKGGRNGHWVVVFPNGLPNMRCESQEEGQRIADAFHSAHSEMRRTGTHAHTCWKCHGVSWCNCGSPELEPLCVSCWPRA